MKTTTLFFAAIVALLSFSSCKKDVEKALKPRIEGLYIGSYDVIVGDVKVDSLYYSYFLREDSVIQFQGLGGDGNTYYGSGRWSLQGTSFNAVLVTDNLGQNGTVQHVEGELKDERLTGTVSNENGMFQGTFSMYKAR